MNSKLLANYEFFKMMEEKVPPNELELPKKFVTVKGSTVPSSVTLESRCGSKWEVSVLKTEGRMWLHGRGWLEFAAHFSLALGNLLFFQYRPNLSFKVSICDATTCQIDYLIKQSQELDEDTDEDEDEDEDKDKLSSPYSEGKNHGSGSKFHNQLFNSTVHASMVHPRFYFQLPTKFWKNHLHGKTCAVILQNSVGKSWSVEICIRDGDRPRPFFKLKNWAAFARANSLVVGDVCRFELIDTAKFEVFVYRGAQISDSDTESSPKRVVELDSGNLSSSSSQQSIERAKKYKAGVSNVDLGSKKLKGRPERNIANSEVSISDDDLGSKEGRQRPKTISNNDSRSKNPRRMRKKKIENSEASFFDDDLGSRQHSQRPNKNIMKSKASVSESYLGSKQSYRQHDTDTKAFLEAAKFTSQNPFFSVTVANGYPYYLDALARFGKSYLKEKSETVTLQIGIKSWLVELFFYQNGSYYLFGGLSEFLAENSLRSGDVCVYELIKRDAVVFRVHIFRNEDY